VTVGRGGARGRLVLEMLDPYGPRTEEIWRALESQASPPYFLSWGWMGNWLACVPRGEAPRLAAVLVDGTPAAAFLLGRRRRVRHLVVASQMLFLNAAGDPRWDAVTLEHNAVLCPPSTRLSLAALVGALPHDWDELVLPALSRERFPGNALDEPLAGHTVRIDGEVPSPYVDLERVRAAPGGYLGLLRSGTRTQIRRAERGLGDVRLDVAASVPEAQEIYEEMVDLHTRSWRARGLPGAFADPWFDGFHRRLIGDRFDRGETQLLRLRSRGATVGCLYNLVSAGRVLFYQSGFPSFDDPHVKPGYVCHAAAVRHNAAAGHSVYDLLGGGSRYKLSLATDQVGLVWARVQRRSVRFAVEEGVRRWKRAVESRVRSAS
jgi:CelD/BcsL family acetyltransferase involved in cellulose biosynthesis